MTEALRSWIVGIAGAAMVTAVAMTVTPEGRVKKVVSLVCGLMTVIALIKPVVGFDYGSFSEYLARYKNEAESFSADIEDTNENLTRRIIEERSEAYILDKGKSLGMTDLDASVQLSWSVDGFWFPSGAALKTNADAEKRQELGRAIEAELGIPSEELNWSGIDE
jgi:stage III sporulation protein AF